MIFNGFKLFKKTEKPKEIAPYKKIKIERQLFFSHFVRR